MDVNRSETLVAPMVSLSLEAQSVLARMAFLLLVLSPSTSAAQTADDPANGRIICPPVSVKHRRMVKPTYPLEAKIARVSGKVTVEVLIDKQGVPKSIRLINGNPMLVKAVLDAVQQWRWNPYRPNGKAAELETRVTINFELR